ncbi:MAG: LptF/LptG family permease [Gemmatimonadota bacterium]|nr:LptF/LptG family permease [Gemmatimonadota bacterium]
MRILTRYILRQLIAPFSFAVVTLTALMLLDQVAKRFPQLVGKGLGARVVVEVFFYSIPFILAMIVPMAVLVAVLYAFNRLAGDNEITAMKASGVSLARLTLPVVFAGAVLAVGMVRFNDTILPDSNHKLSLLLQSIARKSPTFALREREMNEIAEKKLFLLAQRKEQARDLLVDVQILDVADPAAERVIYADSARMALQTGEEGEDLYLTLYDGVIHEASARSPDQFQRTWFARNYLRVPQVATALDRGRRGVRGDRELPIDSMAARVEFSRERAARSAASSRGTAVAWAQSVLAGLAPDTVPPDSAEATLEGWRTGRRISSPQAAAASFRTQALSAEQYLSDADRYEVEIWKKYSIPAACIVFVIIGAPVAVRYRRAGIGLVVGVSLVVFCAYYVALIGGEHLADNRIASPFWAMWSPNILFLLIGVGAFLRARRAGG